MPKLPSSEDLGDGPKLQSGRPIATIDYSPLYDGQMAIGQAVKNVGGNLASVAHVLNRQAEKDKREAEYLDENKATADFGVKRIDLDTEAAGLNDPAQLAAHRGKYQAAFDEAAAKITDPKQRELFTLRHAPAVAGAGAKIDGRIEKIQSDRDLAAADDDLYKTKMAAIADPDPASRKQTIDAARARIDELAAKGRITEAQAVIMKRTWVEDMSTRSLNMLPPEERAGILRGPVDPKNRDAILDRIGGIENATGNPAARSSTSSAMGNFQFIEGTWLRYMRRYRPDITGTDAQLLALRADPKLSREMAGNLLDENAKLLKAAGLPVTPGTLYLAHFAGVGDPEKGKGAIGLLRASPDTPTSAVFSQAAIGANRKILAGKTAGDVVAWADRKMGGDARATELAQYIPPDKRQIMLAQADREASKQTDQQRQADRDEEFRVKDLMKADTDAIVRGGKPVEELTPERVEQAFGPGTREDFELRRRLATDYRDTTENWQKQTMQEVEAKVAAMKADVDQSQGSREWNAKQDFYEKARSQAVELRKVRDSDPAGEAIAQDPQVIAAMQEYERQGGDTRRPQGFQEVVAARLAAQERIGIDKPMIASADEVRTYATRLRPMAPGQVAAMEQTQNETIDQTVDEIYTKYGPENAQKVVSAVLAHVSMRKDASDVFSEAVNRARTTPYGPLITKEGARRMAEEDKRITLEQATRVTNDREIEARRDAYDEADRRDRGRGPTPDMRIRDTVAKINPTEPPGAIRAPDTAAAKPSNEIEKNNAAPKMDRKQLDAMLAKDRDGTVRQVIGAYGEARAKQILGAEYEAYQYRKANP